MGYDWNHGLNGDRRDDPGGHRRRLAADLLQLPVLPRRAAVDPGSLREAAAIDGAGPVKRFFTITFPLLSPTTFFLMVVNIVYTMFETFGVIHATTQGGPSQATNILVYKVYNDGFLALKLGPLGGAIGGADGDRHRADGDPVPLRRAAGELLMDRAMIENRPVLTFLAHLVLILGVVIVAFPVYIALIASTHGPERLHVGDDPADARAATARDLQPDADLRRLDLGRAAVGHHDVQQPDDGAGHRAGQDRHLDPVGLCHRLFPLPRPDDRVLGDLHHPDAAGRGAHRADLQGGRRPGHAEQLRRPDRAADRLGHRHLPVPPGVPDHPRRVDGGGADRRRRAVEVLLGHPDPAVAAPTWRRCS